VRVTVVRKKLAENNLLPTTPKLAIPVFLPFFQQFVPSPMASDCSILIKRGLANMQTDDQTLSHRVGLKHKFGEASLHWHVRRARLGPELTAAG
jgi:hypothetical protein